MRKTGNLVRLGTALVLMGAALVACGNSGGKTAGTAKGTEGLAAYAGPDKILTSDAGSKSVTIALVAGEGAVAKGFNFNGYANGDMHLQVPTGWSVKVSLVDAGTMPHSALIVPWDEQRAGTLHAAFAGSAGADFRAGIEKGDPAQSFAFTADKAGRYALVCGVAGHVDLGMWDEFDVVDNLTAPQVLVK